MDPRPPPYQGCKAANLDAEKFKEWLFKEYRPKTAKNRLSYALRFKHCLLTRDFSELKLLSDDTRIHTMQALAALAKFLGIYDDFKTLVRNYGLKWSNNNRDSLIIARFTKTVNSNEILEWIKKVKTEIPEYSAFMDFIATTGLRYEEAVNSWNLIIQLAQESRLSECYKTDSETLEHFRFKEQFIRRTKKAFVSFVSKDVIERICKSKRLTTNVLTKRIQRRKMRLRFSDIREFHGTVLTKHLRQPEIDFLHGRISTTVFMRNYFNPAWITDLKDRTLKAESEIMARMSA